MSSELGWQDVADDRRASLGEGGATHVGKRERGPDHSPELAQFLLLPGVANLQK